MVITITNGISLEINATKSGNTINVLLISYKCHRLHVVRRPASKNHVSHSAAPWLRERLTDVC